MDLRKIEQGVRLILEGIGEQTDREGLRETPERIARAYEEIFGGMQKSPAEPLKKTFQAQANAMVLERNIPFYSMCEHHLLPFFGVAHIAYLPEGKVVGLSKLARTVEIFARRPQLQERLTAQIADAVMEHLKPRGVMVMLQAEHLCMTMRGVNKPGTQTTTLAMRGEFQSSETMQASFLQMVK